MSAPLTPECTHDVILMGYGDYTCKKCGAKMKLIQDWDCTPEFKPILTPSSAPITPEELGLFGRIADYVVGMPRKQASEFSAIVLRHYVSKQTAAKDERIAELEKAIIDGYKVGSIVYVSAELLKEQDERIKELEEQVALANVRTKVHMNNELGKDSRIASMEAELKEFAEDRQDIVASRQRERDAKNARISELEKVLQNKLVGEAEGNIIHASDAYHEIANILSVKEGGSVIASVQQLLEKVEQLEKKRGKIQENIDWYKEQYEYLRDAYSKVVPDRDRAFGLLEEVKHELHKANGNTPTYWISILLNQVSDLLSSRENKKP